MFRFNFSSLFYIYFYPIIFLKTEQFLNCADAIPKYFRFPFEQSKVYNCNMLFIYVVQFIVCVDKVKSNKFAEEKLYLLQK